MQRKLQTLEGPEDIETHARASTCAGSAHDQPFSFSKNVLTRGQIRELFTAGDFKKLKIARKRNSQPFTSGGCNNITVNKSHSVTKKKSSIANNSIIKMFNNSSGLVLEAWPMQNRKTSVFTLNNDFKRSKNSNANIDKSSIQTLQSPLSNELCPEAPYRTHQMLNKQSDLSNPIKGDHCMTDRHGSIDRQGGKIFGVPKNMHFDQGILQSAAFKQEGLNT